MAFGDSLQADVTAEGGTTMDYRRLGRTDIKVSAIGFGCWEVGGTYGSIDAASSSRRSTRRLIAA